MGEWLIYGSNGTQKATVKKLEYSGEFMGETSVSCDIYSPSPISFSIGDYLVYRGERFTIDYDATRLKQARNNTYGKGYTYENMRFLSYVGELKKCEFLDFVPSDNLIHFSQLPDFSFYAETVKDLADRLQANLDRIYTGSNAWSVQVVQGFEGKENINVSVSKATCFDALRMAYDQFEATFIIRGRTITIGTAGNELETDFKYGKGNGLKTIERSVDESDSLVTRLRAYGNTTNLPANYYKNIGMRVYAPIYEIYHVSTTGCDIHFVPKLKNACFSDKNGQYNYWVTVSLDETLWLKAVASPNNHLSSTAYSVVSVGLYGSNTQAQVTQFLNQLQSGTYDKLYFKEGINVGAWPVEYREYAENVPNLMAIDRLMLPGFPELTTDPYIDASNISTLGVREKSVYFDGSDPDTPDIHPTLEGMTAAELRAAGYTIDLDAGDNGNLDEIAADATETDGSPITADGAFEGVDEVPGFKVTIKDIGFDINDYLSTETATLVMKTGMCGGREFTIVNVEKVGNKYVLECQRTEDVSHYFPYNPYLIKAGDKFVLTNIGMPKAYIDAASQRLLAAAQAYIAKYSAPQWVYAIKMDDIWMQRQRDNSVSEASSYYWNIKEGDVMNVTDSDLGVDIAEVIDRLTIREGYGPIPEFEVVLRKEKPQGTIGVLQNRIRQLELRNAEQADIIRRQQNYLTFIFGDTLADVMSQLDKKAETWYQANDPSSAWTNDEDKAEHVGDLWMDTSANGGKKTYIYQNTGTSDSPNYQWVEQYVPDEVFDEIDGKAEIFVEKPTAYHERDMWIIENGISSSDLPTGCVAGDIVISSTDSTSFNKAHWSKKDRYTDDSSLNAFLNGYTGTLTGIRNDITNASSAAATAQATADALDYLKQAYLADNTLIDHGLILSTIVALRDSSNNVWSGISGAYDSTKLGNGIAAWYGGGMIDKEVSAVSNAAKSLFRFDGSGYVANGNLKWDANGNVTIQGYSINATTLQVGGSNVATQAMLDNFVSKAFFNRLFTAYDANGNAIVPNDTTTAINNLKIMIGAWTEQYLSALGKNNEGSGGGTGDVSHIKIGTNPDVFLDPDEDGIIDMSSYAANWNDAYQKRHTHSNKSVLDGITSTKVSHWDAVYGVVPSAAYETGNSLADKNFVNSSISTSTATFRGTNTTATTESAFLTWANGLTHDLNDYVFWSTKDSAGNTIYKRYKYDGSQWVFEYDLNNSSFTSDQWSAINSGITSTHVSKLNGIASGAQVNVIESIKVNGNALSISSKAVDITAVPLTIITGADDLKAIEGLSGTGFLKRTGNNTWALDTTVVLSTRKVSTGNGLQGGGDLSADRTISILLPTNSGLSVASTGLKLDIVNNLTTASDYRAISATQAKKIWDLLNQMFTLEGAGTTASPYVIKANYGLYTNQFLSALGQNSQGGSGGGMGEDEMWAALQANTGTYENAKINWNHIPLATTSTAGAIKVGSTLAISNGILNQATIPNLTADVYTKVTVDTYGRVTQGGDLLADDIPSLSMSKISGLSTALGNVYTKTESDGKYLTALGTSGNYLTYTKNGNSNSITVPYATSAGTATKLGTSTVGNYTTPIYLNNGTPTQVSYVDGAIVRGYIGNNGQKSYLAIHPEENGEVILPFIFNDIAFLEAQGGSFKVYSTTDTDLTADTLTIKTDWSSRGGITNMFDGSPSYFSMPVEANTEGVIIDIVHPKLFSYGTTFYIDFGNQSWGFENIDVYTKNSNSETSYIAESVGGQVAKNARYFCALNTTRTSHDRLRIHLYGRTRNDGARIAQVGIVNYVSIGSRQTLMSRGIDDPVYRSITPATNGTYNLGTSAYRWNYIYSTYGNFSADVAVGNHLWLENNRQISFKDSSGVSKQALILDNGNLLNIGYGTSSSGYNTQINGNIIYLNYGTSHNPGLVINSNGNATIHHALTVTGSTILNGNVGIGTTSPAYKLDVNGDVRADNFRGALIGNASSATKATQDNDGNTFIGYYLRKVSVPNNTTNDFNTFENMTLTGRGDPTTGASLSHAPWTGRGPAGGYGVLTYLWSVYGIQMAWGYANNHIYIRNKYYSSIGIVWSDSWSTIALTSDNVASATKLQTARTIWGQNFDGTANVSGTLTDTGSILPLESVTHDIGSDSLAYRYVYATWIGSPTNKTLHFGANNQNHIAITTDGKVGIGTTSPSSKLHVAGNILASGEVTASSDERLKTIVGDGNLDLRYIANAPNILFKWNNGQDDKVHGGSLAQYFLHGAKHFVLGSDKDYYSLNYGALATSMAISIAKEVVKHDDEITRLKKVVVKQAEEIVELKNKVREFEERRVA